MMFLGFFIFSLSSVQTSLARRLTNALQTATNQELQFNKIQIDLLGNVSFRGVVGFDHRKDTLFYIKEFKAALTAPSKAFQGNIEFESVDQIVAGQLSSIESDKFNKNLLLDIYRNL